MAIFLDHHSTTPVYNEVREEIIKHLGPQYGNAQSQHHAWGWTSSRAIGLARDRVAACLGVKSQQIFFTSGATESLFTAICGWYELHKDSSPLMALSQLEHHSTREAYDRISRQGANVEVVPVDHKGHLDLDTLRSLCTRGLKFITLVHAHNEIGTVQKLDLILPLLKEYGVVVHLDISQSVGKVPFSLGELDVDFASLTGHKFGAPQGIGALFCKDKSSCAGLFTSSPSMERLGTPPVAMIAGLGKAAELASREHIEFGPRWLSLRERLLEGLKELDDTLTVNGCWESRLPNNLNVSVPKLNPSKLSTLATRLAVSTSSACTSGDVLNPTLSALGVPPDLHRKTLRFGLGIDTTEETISEAVNLLKSAF
jgi:cysteine desulfurase